jgi:hypothetical protein
MLFHVVANGNRVLILNRSRNSRLCPFEKYSDSSSLIQNLRGRSAFTYPASAPGRDDQPEICNDTPRKCKRYLAEMTGGPFRQALPSWAKLVFARQPSSSQMRSKFSVSLLSSQDYRMPPRPTQGSADAMEPIVIPRSSSRDRSRRTEKDSQKIAGRRRALGPRYDAMVQALELIFGQVPLRDDLSVFARRMAAEKHLHVDRASSRVKEGLICWLCENCSSILSDCPPAPRIVDPRPETCPPFDSTEDEGSPDDSDSDKSI